MEYLTMYKANETKHKSAAMVATVTRNGFIFSKLFIAEGIPELSHKVYEAVMGEACPEELRAMLVTVSHAELERIKQGYYKA